MGLLYGRGVMQSDLSTLVSLLTTNFNGILAKLDADATVSGTTYVSANGVTAPGVTYETAVGQTGMSQAGLHTWLNSFTTKFNAALTHLDGDAGVADTNYNALWALSMGSMVPNGMSMGQIVAWLNKAITNIAGVTAKLDADGTVTDTNYGSLWNVTDTVDETGAVLS